MLADFVAHTLLSEAELRVIEYDYEVLKSIREPSSVNFKFTLFVDDEFIGEKLEVV